MIIIRGSSSRDAVCSVCGKVYRKRRSHSRFCSGICRQSAYRRRCYDKKARLSACRGCGRVFGANEATWQAPVRGGDARLFFWCLGCCVAMGQEEI